MWKRIWEQRYFLPSLCNPWAMWTLIVCCAVHRAVERFAIEHYFERCFCYKIIVLFLVEYHRISINERTLKRRLRQYEFRTRDQVRSEHPFREIIEREIDGPSSLLGYRRMWNKLRTSSCSCDKVMRILRELDPDASALRRARKLQRRSTMTWPMRKKKHVPLLV